MVDSIKVLRFFSPIRIIEFIALLSLIPIFNIAWQSAVIIFNYFFPIIIGSIVYEAILEKGKFREGLKKIGWKYFTGISMQFLGIAVFALSSFNQDPDKIPTIAMYSLLVIAIGGGLEAFHNFSTKKFKDVKLSPAQQVLAVIGFTVCLFFMALHAYFIAIPRIFQA